MQAITLPALQALKEKRIFFALGPCRNRRHYLAAKLLGAVRAREEVRKLLVIFEVAPSTVRPRRLSLATGTSSSARRAVTELRALLRPLPARALQLFSLGAGVRRPDIRLMQNTGRSSIMQQQKDTLVGWLNDAYALERNLENVLENHAKDAKDFPQVASGIRQHLEETRRHAELVKGLVERLGGSTSAVKTAMGKVSGLFAGMSTGVFPDELVKNALSDYAAEHFEIASYRGLIVAARALGENDVVRVCEQILRDEENMARWLEQNLPVLVQEHLGREVAVGSGAGSFRTT
jgi:ferritin-like metal-binding protein YciE